MRKNPQSHSPPSERQLTAQNHKPPPDQKRTQRDSLLWDLTPNPGLARCVYASGLHLQVRLSAVTPGVVVPMRDVCALRFV
jgi:hypothetical protein